MNIHMLVPFIVSASALASTNQGLTLSIFNNTALAGQPATTSLVPTPNYTHPNGDAPFSALITGTLSVARGYAYNFTCDFGGAVLGYAHIDGHLVCQTGANGPHQPAPPSVISVAYDLPLPVLSSSEWPVRFAVVHNGSSAGPLSVGMSITRIPPFPSKGGAAWLPVAGLSPALPKAEAQRDEMQAAIASGWGPWYDMSYTKLVRLPEGSALALMLCDSGGAGGADGATRCIEEARVDWGPPGQGDVSIRLGAHAYDRSYLQMYLATATCNVSIVVGGGDDLLASVEIVSGCDGTELVLTGSSAWYRMHEVSAAAQSLSFTPYGDGVRSSVVHATQPSKGSALVLPPDVESLPHLRFDLSGGGTVGFSSDAPLTAAQIEAKLLAAWKAEQARYDAYGEHAEVKMAVQSGAMWNVVYNPLESVIAPVIRGNPWGWDPAVLNDDWPYVLFDWDTHFASYMLSLDKEGKEIGYSVLIEVVKAKSAEGYVPNGWAPTRKSTHSQPPVGSRVLLEMYKKYKDLWMVELLFDDLLDWSNWFFARRILAPLNMTALGGDNMQAARYESGLDDSPMYDGEFFAVTDNKTGYGLMQMYDVGMASMVAMSDECLAELADAIGRADAATMLRARSADAKAKIAANLWDEQSGIFVNRLATGAFNRRISPTSFYPMQTGIATAPRATSMVSGWLLNASRFCIAPKGDFAGNPDTCYWGLPSISADDPAFPPLGYWRGFVWGPMALLTYWGLAHEAYTDVPLVTTARAAMCKQMGALFLSQWRAHRHVCENFSPWRNATECTGMHFYHWGALAGFIGLLDAGFYQTPPEAVGVVVEQA